MRPDSKELELDNLGTAQWRLNTASEFFVENRDVTPVNIKLPIYFAAKAVGLFALCRLLTRSRIRILGYHGACLGDESNYNPFLFVQIDTFKRRLDWLLKKKFNVISLENAVDALDGNIDIGRLPTVITFDDGWQSTATNLIPILAEKGLSSTLYLHTSHFKEDWPVLIVTVNYMIWKSNYQSIEVKNLGATVDGKYQLDETEGRKLFYQKVHKWLVSPPTTREKIIERIHHLAKIMSVDVDDLALDTRRFDYMTRDLLLQLSRLNCTVEMHGHHHRYPMGDPGALAADLSACREVILNLGLPEPRHYCYPSGNFDDAAENTLAAFGIKSAMTCRPGLISKQNGGPSRAFLPRFLDSEHIDMLTFQAELSGFADILRRAAGR